MQFLYYKHIKLRYNLVDIESTVQGDGQFLACAIIWSSDCHAMVISFIYVYE